MKRLFYITILIFTFVSLKAHTPLLQKMTGEFRINLKDTAPYTESRLLSIDIAYYLNRPVNDFLAALDIAAPGYILSKVYGGHQMRLASRINAYYFNGLTFIIVVTNFTHMQQFNSNSQWDVNLFRQEIISNIELHKKDTCLASCPDQ